MNKQLFFFAAKVGSHEGYIYKRDKLDKLDDWVNNIVSLYHELPLQTRKDVWSDLSIVLNRILTYGANTMDSRHKLKISELLAEAS